MASELMAVEYESLSGIAVKIDAKTVRDTLTRGNGNVSDQEVAMFLRTCQAKKLDPFENGEVYLIKYDDKSPANMVVGYFAYIRRADKFPDYRGFKAGVVVAFRNGKDSYRYDDAGMPIIDRREGAAVYRMFGEELIGGWCRVFRERNGKTEETYMEVPFSEYSTGKSNWNVKPATMLRKVAISQAFRAAFPNEYEGLYTEDEMIAGGAIPVQNYAESGSTPDSPDRTEGQNGEDDPVITQDQRKALISTAQRGLGKIEGNALLIQLIKDQGYESSYEVKTSSFDKIMKNLAAEIERRTKEKEGQGKNGSAETAAPTAESEKDGGKLPWEDGQPEDDGKQ